MRKQLRVGDVAVAPLPGGGFGACQVSGFDGESVVIHALDWSSPEPPGLDDLRGVGPAVLRRHRFREEIAQTSVAPKYHPLPPDFTWIGNLPVPPGVPGEVNSISGWDWPLAATVVDREWAELPEEVRAARRLSRGADPVTVDRGAGPQTETTALDHLDLSEYPVERPMDWSVLDRLPRLTEISWSGPDRGLVAALERHPMISSLAWCDAPDTVDLTRTRVTSLRISGDSLRRLHLPPRARSLSMDGPSPFPASPPAPDAPHRSARRAPSNLAGDTSGSTVSSPASARTVHALDDGRWLHLDIVEATPATRAPAGLSGVRSVSLSGRGTLSAETLTAFPEAHTVSLRWTTPPGCLDNPAALTALPALRLLEMVDAYEVDADTLPDLDLDDLLIFGLRGSTARGLRARFRKSPVTLSLMGAKSDRWLAANLDNPFRDWADDDPTAGAAACKAYATALTALDKLTTASPGPSTALPSSPTSPNTKPLTGSTNPGAQTLIPSPSPDRETLTPSSGPDRETLITPAAPNTETLTADTSPGNGSLTAPTGPRIGSVPAGTAPGISSMINPAEAVLRELVEKLNAIDEKFDIIDTVRREEAADAFLALSARGGIPSTTAAEWFDDWREF